jgi:hypothetical protein
VVVLAAASGTEQEGEAEDRGRPAHGGDPRVAATPVRNPLHSPL